MLFVKEIQGYKVGNSSVPSMRSVRLGYKKDVIQNPSDSSRIPQIRPQCLHFFAADMLLSSDTFARTCLFFHIARISIAHARYAIFPSSA